MPFIHLFYGCSPYPFDSGKVAIHTADQHSPKACTMHHTHSRGSSGSTILSLLMPTSLDECNPKNILGTMSPANSLSMALPTDLYAHSSIPMIEYREVQHAAHDKTALHTLAASICQLTSTFNARVASQSHSGRHTWQVEVRYRILYVFRDKMQQIHQGDLIEFEADEHAHAQSGALYLLLNRCPIPHYSGPGMCFLAVPWQSGQHMLALEVVLFHPLESAVNSAALIALRHPVPPFPVLPSSSSQFTIRQYQSQIQLALCRVGNRLSNFIKFRLTRQPTCPVLLNHSSSHTA
jgi:hypothetical protein